MCMLSCSCHVQLFLMLWTIAQQAPLSMGFSRQEYWSGLLCHTPGDLPDAGIVPKSLQSCLTLYDRLDSSPPGFCVHGILQAGILEWVAMPSSRGSFQPRD